MEDGGNVTRKHGGTRYAARNHHVADSKPGPRKGSKMPQKRRSDTEDATNDRSFGEEDRRECAALSLPPFHLFLHFSAALVENRDPIRIVSAPTSSFSATGPRLPIDRAERRVVLYRIGNEALKNVKG